MTDSLILRSYIPSCCTMYHFCRFMCTLWRIFDLKTPYEMFILPNPQEQISLLICLVGSPGFDRILFPGLVDCIPSYFIIRAVVRSDEFIVQRQTHCVLRMWALVLTRSACRHHFLKCLVSLVKWKTPGNGPRTAIALLGPS